MNKESLELIKAFLEQISFRLSEKEVFEKARKALDEIIAELQKLE